MKKTIIALAMLMSAGAASAAEVTVNGAYSSTDNTKYSLGIAAGQSVMAFGKIKLGVEGSYEFTRKNDAGDQSDVFANGVLSYDMGTLTPYVLAGPGYRWSAISGNESQYNIGAGTKVSLSKMMSLDFRYRRIDNFDNTRPEDKITTGITFKF